MIKDGERWSYWNGPDEEDRRVKYSKAFLPSYQVAGEDVQWRISAIQVAFVAETGIILPGGYSSGWRPATVNEATANAGKLSTHLTADAGDPRDDVDGAFAWWCFRNTYVLERHHVWMEHPIATVVRAWRTALAQKRAPTPWCHLQRVPPASHSRVYFPDKASVAEWDEFLAVGGRPGITHAGWLILHQAKLHEVNPSNQS